MVVTADYLYSSCFNESIRFNFFFSLQQSLFFGSNLSQTQKKLFAPRLELGTSRVLGERHDQLDHANRVVEYLGFDPSTSSLLRTHASNCANTPERHLGDSKPCGQRPLT